MTTKVFINSEAANIGNILNFEDDYSDVQKITLDQKLPFNAKYP